MGARIVGHTPWLEDRGTATRADEVLAYLTSLTEPPCWVVIDDDERGYADATVGARLIVTDGDMGFDERAAAQLAEILGRQT